MYHNFNDKLQLQLQSTTHLTGCSVLQAEAFIVSFSKSSLPCIDVPKYCISLYCKVPNITVACSVLHAVACVVRPSKLRCPLLLVPNIESACIENYPTLHCSAVCCMHWPVLKGTNMQCSEIDFLTFSPLLIASLNSIIGTNKLQR